MSMISDDLDEKGGHGTRKPSQDPELEHRAKHCRPFRSGEPVSAANGSGRRCPGRTLELSLQTTQPQPLCTWPWLCLGHSETRLHEKPFQEQLSPCLRRHEVCSTPGLSPRGLAAKCLWLQAIFTRLPIRSISVSARRRSLPGSLSCLGG